MWSDVLSDGRLPSSSKRIWIRNAWGEEHWWCCSPHAVCWCPGQESNLHASRHTHLKRARLPIPPPGLNKFMVVSGKRDSNSRPQPWQGCALPTELFPQMKGAKTSSGMSPDEISFSVCQCFAVQLSCLRLQRYTFFFIQQTFPYSFLRNNPKFLAQQGNLSKLGR